MIGRIRQLISEKKLSAAQFAAEIGVQRSAVSHLLSGRNKPSLDVILKIKNRFPEISFDWLLLGEGQMDEKIENEKAGSEEVQNDLFSQKPGKQENKQGETVSHAAEPLSDTTIADGEDAPLYGRGIFPGKSASKVILLYPDKTFEEFKAR